MIRMKKLLKRQGMLLLAVFSLLMVFESLAELTHSDYSVFQKVEAKTKKSKKTKATAKTVYSDSYIQVTKTGGTLTFKNVSGKDITLDGTAFINNELEVNSFSFGFIGFIKSGGSKTELIYSLELYDGEDDKHTMKTGETLTWSGDVNDSEGHSLASISFSFQY